jgi:hypothetical protein
VKDPNDFDESIAPEPNRSVVYLPKAHDGKEVNCGNCLCFDESMNSFRFHYGSLVQVLSLLLVGNHMWSGGADGTICVWNLATQKRIKKFKVSCLRCQFSLALLNDLVLSPFFWLSGTSQRTCGDIGCCDGICLVWRRTQGNLFLGSNHV